MASGFARAVHRFSAEFRPRSPAALAGQGHGFFNYKDNRTAPFTDILKKTDAFLVSLGYLKGAGRVDAFVAEIQ